MSEINNDNNQTKASSYLSLRTVSKGSIYIFFYVVTCAFSNVFVNHTTRSRAPVISLFYTSLFTILFFSILNFGELTKNIQLIKVHKKAILWLNMLNTIIWFVIFFSLKFLSPALFSCLFLGAIPLNLFIIGLKKSQVSAKNNFITGVLLVSLFVLMLLLVIQEMDATNYIEILIYGLIVTVIGGITAAFIMKFSKELAVNNLSASLVVSLRFYGLLLVSFLIILLNPKQLLIEPLVIIEFLALGLISMALPLFLLQKALKSLSPLSASIIIICIPVVTYFFQLFSGYYSFSFKKMMITFLFSIILIVLNFFKKKNEVISK